MLGLVTAGTSVKEFDLGIKANGLRKLGDVVVPEHFYNRYSFDNDILNSIFNGDGLMKSQVISMASPRGSGKTTFLMQSLQQLTVSNPELRCAYFSNEECVEQLAFTANRIGATDIMADNVSDIDQIVANMHNLDVLVIDSFPGLSHSEITKPKALEQYAINSIIKTAKATGCAVIIIMHFTKANVESGSKNIYHAVDSCITLTKLDPDEYDADCRMVSVTKNRFGSQSETIIRMTPEGFDLSGTVEVKQDSSSDSVYATAKKHDVKSLMNVIREQNTVGGAKLSDFNKLNIDMGRVERLLKELTSSNKVTVFGGGKGTPKENKRWHLGQVSSSDFDDLEVPVDFH
jgi:predicted ATP-dependent serine protease